MPERNGTNGHESNHARKEEMQVIEQMFLFYCESVGRDPNRYSLTQQRRKKALLRLQERIEVRGSLDAAAAEFAQAIENLAASEWHISNSYIDWLDQIFCSAEMFEKRLSWQKPLQPDTGNGANFESKNARIVREALNELNHRQVGANG